MIILLEIAGLAILLGVVAVLFRAAHARPTDSSLRWVARAGLGAWIVFALMTLVDLQYLATHPWQVATGALIAIAVVGVVLGYRALLIQVQQQADRR